MSTPFNEAHPPKIISAQAGFRFMLESQLFCGLVFESAAGLDFFANNDFKWQTPGKQKS